MRTIILISLLATMAGCGETAMPPQIDPPQHTITDTTREPNWNEIDIGDTIQINTTPPINPITIKAGVELDPHLVYAPVRVRQGKENQIILPQAYKIGNAYFYPLQIAGEKHDTIIVETDLRCQDCSYESFSLHVLNRRFKL